MACIQLATKSGRKRRPPYFQPDYGVIAVDGMQTVCERGNTLQCSVVGVAGYKGVDQDYEGVNVAPKHTGVGCPVLVSVHRIGVYVQSAVLGGDSSGGVLRGLAFGVLNGDFKACGWFIKSNQLAVHQGAHEGVFVGVVSTWGGKQGEVWGEPVLGCAR